MGVVVRREEASGVCQAPGSRVVGKGRSSAAPEWAWWVRAGGLWGLTCTADVDSAPLLGVEIEHDACGDEAGVEVVRPRQASLLIHREQAFQWWQPCPSTHAPMRPPPSPPARARSRARARARAHRCRSSAPWGSLLPPVFSHPSQHRRVVPCHNAAPYSGCNRQGRLHHTSEPPSLAPQLHHCAHLTGSRPRSAAYEAGQANTPDGLRLLEERHGSSNANAVVSAQCGSGRTDPVPIPHQLDRILVKVVACFSILLANHVNVSLHKHWRCTLAAPGTLAVDD